MKRFMQAVILVIIACVLGWGMGSALAAGVQGRIPAAPDKATPILSAVMNAVGNYPSSGQYSNPNGKSEKVMCTAAATGTNTMSIWIQTSRDGVAYVNATTAAMDIVPANSDTLIHFGDILGGNLWRFHVEDTDVDVTNTVTMTCDFWR
jgi:hypothetical protein